MTMTKNAPASEPPQERESFSSIQMARREQTLFELKKDWARSRLDELRWMCANTPSERWKAKLEEAELWARAVGL
jgi:hypothetical protein